jgi:DNA-binding response OmpR family regulator
MLSGWTFESDVAAGHAAGADAYLAKPFDNAELRTLVRELIDRAATRAADGSNAPPTPTG